MDWSALNLLLLTAMCIAVAALCIGWVVIIKAAVSIARFAGRQGDQVDGAAALEASDDAASSPARARPVAQTSDPARAPAGALLSPVSPPELARERGRELRRREAG